MRKDRLWFTALVVGISWFVAVPSGAAEPVAVVVASDDDTLVFTKAEDDSVTADLTLTNASDGTVNLKLAPAVSNECSFTLTPAALPAHRTVSFKVGAKNCPAADGMRIVLSEQGDSGSVLAALTAKVKKSSRVDLGGVLVCAGIAAVFGAAAMVIVWCRLPPGISRKRWGEALPGVDGKWSFTDSWATNISAFATVLVALLGTKDVLGAVLGDAPETFVGRLLVAGAIAGFFTGAAPLAVKAIGKTAKATVGGVLVGGFLTTTGVLAQLLTLAWATCDTGLDRMVRRSGVALALLGCAVMLSYAVKSLRNLITEAFETAPRAVAPELFIAAAASLPRDASVAEIRTRARELAAGTARVSPDANAANTNQAPGTQPERNDLRGPVVATTVWNSAVL